MKRLSLFSIFLICILSAPAQKPVGRLSGKVTDAASGEPLAGASISLVEARIGTNTDSLGQFIFNNIPLGHATVEVSFFGFKTIVEHVDIHGTEIKNFTLSPSIIVNQGVTVTAVGSATSIRKAPIAITRVNKSELLSTASTNIIDALTRQPGINQLSTGPAISKPVIRGLGYNRLVVINDGIRQEGQQWGDEHGIEIDENSVSRVEIVKGPASLIYGSDALAGVINIITTMPAATNTLKGSILSSYQTNNKQRSLFGNFGGNVSGFNWNLWGDVKSAADYKNKYDGRVFNSKFTEKNYGGYVGYNAGWGFSHFIISRFHQKPGVIEGERDGAGFFVRAIPGGTQRRVTDEEFDATTAFTPYQDINHLKIISENSFKAGRGRISLNLGWQRNQRKEFGNPDDPEETSLYFDLPTFNYNTAFHLDDKKGWTTAIGVTGMVQNNKNKGLEALIPEYRLFDVGGFVYTQKTIGRSTVSGGFRYDKRDLHAYGMDDGGLQKFIDFKKKFYNVSASAGVSYEASDKVLLKINLARGFRAPSLPELASNGAHEGTNRYEYGNNSLTSETSWQGDGSFEVNSDHLLFSFGGFYNHINNFIYYRKLSGKNGGDSLVSVGNDMVPAFKFDQQSANLAGLEALVDFHPHPLDWFHWENTFSLVRGKFSTAVEGNRNVPFIPAAHWISELRAELLKKGKTVSNLNLSFEMDKTFEQNNPFLAYGTETATPAYALFNAGINANIASRNKTLFSVYLLAKNITDVAYQSHLSRLKYAAVNAATGRQGVYNSGRNFVFKLNIPLSFAVNERK